MYYNHQLSSFIELNEVLNQCQVNLEKNEDRWWDRLFTADPPINVRTLDTTVNTSELSPEDHMKIQELVVGQDRRQNISAVDNVTFNDTLNSYSHI